MKKKKTKQANETDRGVPDDFSNWWYPSGTDPISGASIGGHPDASRCWSRKDPGRFTHRHYGMTAQIAWLNQQYRDEYQDWIDSGKPERAQPFVSNAATIEEQLKFWRGVHGLLAQIGRPMPRTHHDVVNPRRGDAPKQAKARIVEPPMIEDGEIKF